MFRTALILVCFAFTHTSFAETDQRTPVEAFRAASWFRLAACKFPGYTAATMADHPKNDAVAAIEALESCRSPGWEEVKTLFARANRTVSKKPSASARLKDYYAAWIGAMRGLSPAIGESGDAYYRRQDSAVQKLDEMWARFEIEAGL